MCDPILVSRLEMQPHHSQSSRENASPSGGTSLHPYFWEVRLPSALYLKLAYQQRRRDT